MTRDAAPALVEVDALTIDYASAGGTLRAVEDVSFRLAAGEVLGLVGESGSGKSTVAMALLGHVGGSGRVAAGRVLLEGEDLLRLPAPLLARRRGRRIGFVPQNPATALSPHLSVGAQFTELVEHHGIAQGRSRATALALEQFALVGLPEPERLARRYPHELSGGQQQRVCIAMAAACRPELLVLDEPTTGLDVTTQARIIDLLRDLRARLAMAMLYVTHDLGVLAQIADRVGVMYAGRLVELAPLATLFAAPRHPYSRGLIASMPSLDGARRHGAGLRGLLARGTLPAGCPFAPRCDHALPDCHARPQHMETVAAGHRVACQRWRDIPAGGPGQAAADDAGAAPAGGAPLIELDGVRLGYQQRRWWRRLLRRPPVDVVRDLSLVIATGEIFALVGESGSGKSTIARSIGGLLAPTAGTLRCRGVPMAGTLRRRSAELKREIQYVFQNPDASLNPRERVRAALMRPLRAYFRLDRAAARRQIEEALDEVRLDLSYAERYPDELSGGERQRIAVARALVAGPALILCDEILSALDVSVQSAVIDLLARLRGETGVAMLFISHDLAVVRHLADRTAVLFSGTVVELGATADLFTPPFHPYTEELLLAAPSARRKSLDRSVRARPRSPAASSGCIYAARCTRHRGRICDEQPPPWQTVRPGHAIRCHIPPAELAGGSATDSPAALTGRPPSLRLPEETSP